MDERSTTGLALEISRVLRAHPRFVFQAFTDGSRLAQWWGPAGFTIPSVTLDPRAGRRYRIEMKPPDGDAFFLAGEMRGVEPPSRLAFTFAWEDPDPDDVENLVELFFDDLGSATNLTMTQQPFLTEARRALHQDGWTESLDKLEALLVGSDR